MAKRKYQQRDSGLFVPGNDSIELPKPRAPKPWYAGVLSGMSNRFMGRRRCCSISTQPCPNCNNAYCGLEEILAHVGTSFSILNCNRCPDVGDDYVLQKEECLTPAVCSWCYKDGHDLVFGGESYCEPPVGYPSATSLLSMGAYLSGGASCKFSFGVVLAIYVYNDIGHTCANYAQYESDVLADGWVCETQSTPLTLTKVYEYATCDPGTPSVLPCTGSFDDEMTVEF